ncbi:DNA repair exonuclease [Virgibacillus sp. NKC19-3]|uniref:metallophosphoesterase family protein n=1 Tax=Virgibacillus saliphilus TaxID=2831674 RepID=UPI001C9B8CF1|nr:DNA repair exonuclease [Virgibacillus sp. NKC19-3]MBY7143031.1 DNA repair exonuclease [Virgibacillus sp. NKC19-3]
MANQISFIHAADLHLDSLFKGLAGAPDHIFQEILESTFTALDYLIQVAIDKQVDFVLIAGDLFDNEKQSLKAQVRLRRAFEKLESHDIHVYASHGNHDYINGNMHPVTYPDNVHIFPDEQVRQFVYHKDDQTEVAIYGFSYENRAVLTKKVDEYRVTDPSIPYHIAMLHGSVQSNTEHDTYAPFQVQDLVEYPFDYWALGHIHQREILKQDPPIVYPGNIQGRHRKETGEKGCYHVVLTETGADMTFIPLQAIRFHILTVDVSMCNEIHQIENKIQEALKNCVCSTPMLIDLTLTGDNSKLKEWENENDLDEVIELVNETRTHQQNWKFIFRYSLETYHSLLDTDLYKGEHFIGELARHFEEVAIQPFLKELYQHKQARKYIEPLNQTDEEFVKTQAKQLLFMELLKD